MKRQATYQPPFNCWRLPSAKTKTKIKPKKEHKKRAPPPTPVSKLPLFTSPPSEDDLPVDAETTNNRAVVHPRKAQVPSNPPYTSTDPYGALVRAKTPPGAGTLEDIGRWWHHRQSDEVAARRFNSAACFWADGLWDLARIDETMFTCLTAFAASKMSKLTGVDACKTNLIMKGRIMELLSRQLSQVAEGTAAGVTFVAISVLALLDMRDGELETAQKHLLALRQFVQAEHMTGHEWLYCVWVDLRFAILRRKPPVLPFFVAPEFRHTPPACLRHHAEAQKLALRNAKDLPLSDLFSFGQVFVQFRKLHELGLAWEELYAGSVPAFAQVYELDYQLLTYQAKIWSQSATPSTSTTTMGGPSTRVTDALAMHTMQLHVWLLSRFWIPQKRITYVSILQQMHSLLLTHNDNLVSFWRSASSSNDISSLLWIVFTFTSLALDFLPTSSSTASPSATSLGIALLTDIANALKLRRERDFARILRKWPWIERWHAAKVTLLWVRIRARLHVPVSQWDKVVDEGQRPSLVGGGGVGGAALPDHHYFVGGFEFYDAGG